MSEAMSDRSSFHEWQRNYYKGLVQRGVERGLFAEVPWCAEHDEKMDTFDPEFNVGWCRKVDDCRLEEPARHLVIREAE